MPKYRILFAAALAAALNLPALADSKYTNLEETSLVPLPDAQATVREVPREQRNGGSKDGDVSISAGATTEEIADRLRADMMFAGKLADQLLESGYYGKLIPVEKDDDRASLRTRLIFWERANAEVAARLWRDAAEDTDGDGNLRPDEIKLKTLRFGLSTKLVGLLKDAKESASGNRQAEDISYAADRLFTGEKNYDAKMYAGSSGAVYAGGGGGARKSAATMLAPFPFKLDAAGAAKEDKFLSSWLGNLQNELTYDKARAAKRLTATPKTLKELIGNPAELEKALNTKVGDKTVAQLLAQDFGTREKLLSSATTRYRDFAGFMSRFISRNDLQEMESTILEKLRKNMRGDMARLYILARAFDVKLAADDITATFREGYVFEGFSVPFMKGYIRSAGLLRREAAALNAAYAALYRDMDTLPLNEAYKRLQQLDAIQIRLKTISLFMSNLPALHLLAQQTGTPVFLERITLPLLVKRHPDSEYTTAVRALSVYKKAIREGIRLLGSGEFDRALALFAATREDGNAQAALAELNKQTRYSVAVVRKPRDKAEIIQALFIEGPFYHPAVPLVRAVLENPDKPGRSRKHAH